MRISIPKNVSIETRLCLQQISSELHERKSPTFASFTLTNLTASRLVSSDANKKLVSTDLNSWIAGTANEIDITDDGDGTVTIGIVNPLIVAKGGTGVATLTDGGLLLGSGTGAITPLGQATNGQLPIGSTGSDPVLATLTGTANQVIVTNAAGSIALSTPQDIHTGASPTFAGLTSEGTIISDSFYQTGITSNYFSAKVGIGESTPTNPFHIHAGGADNGGSAGYDEVVARFHNTAVQHTGISVDATTGKDAILMLAENGRSMWGIRNDASDGNKFNIRYQGRTSANITRLSLTTAGLLTINGNLDAGTNCEANAYTVGGVTGIDFNGVVTNITVVKGIVTAAS